MLKEIREGDELFICGSYEKKKILYRWADDEREPNYPSKGQCGFQKTNGPTVVFYELRNQYEKEEQPCEICGAPYS